MTMHWYQKMTKDQLIMRDIVLPSGILRPLVRGKRTSNAAMDMAGLFKIEHLVELAMAEIGDYTFLDESGYDFSDFSDCKTASIGVPEGKASGAMAISALGTKIGAIRAVIYNPFYNRLDYMFFPYEEWKKYSEPKYKSGHIVDSRIRSTFNKKKNSYSKGFDQYLMNSFEALCLI